MIKTRNTVRFVLLSCAITSFITSAAQGTAFASIEPADQLSQTTTTTTQTTTTSTTVYRPLYTASLDASFDWGDLGWDWQKTLGIQGTETLWFRWKIGASTATKGRWQITNASNVLLAQGEVGAAQTAGEYFLFLINLDTLNIAPPPYNVRLQALTSTGTAVGQISPAVVLEQAAPQAPTCFTDGGLGLPITEKLQAIRAAHGVPAVGGAVVTKSGVEVFDAVGIRKIQWFPVSVTKYDKWHLGSDTKAMTSMLVGLLRQAHPWTIGWNTTVAQAFPEWAGTMNATFAQTTLRQLLAHRSGLYKFSDEQSAKLWQSNLTVKQQRRAFTNAVAHDPYLMAPGVMYRYDNANYIIAGAMLENMFGQSWETLITQYLFQPLGMTSAGFGGPAANGAAQPWGHWDNNGVLTPSDGDNIPSLGPAGTVHASLTDWAKFIRLYLNGYEGSITLWSSTRTELMTAYTSSDPWFVVWDTSYGWGWGVSKSGDKVLGHDGSNMAWYARAVVNVDKGYALLAVTNAATLGDINPGMNAVNDVTTMLEKYHTGCPDYSSSLVQLFTSGR